MRGMNSASVDLIYLDPPFNSKRDYEAPIGSAATGASFKDTWTLDDVDLAWHGEIAEDCPPIFRYCGGRLVARQRNEVVSDYDGCALAGNEAHTQEYGQYLSPL